MPLSIKARADIVDITDLEGETCARHKGRPALWLVQLRWPIGKRAATIALCGECVDRVKHSDYDPDGNDLPF